MDMLTDLLSTVAEGGKVLLEEENYLLARVKIDGRAMFAEISRGYSGGISPGDWPAIDGILLPDSIINPSNDSETRILLFSIPETGELFVEKLVRDGGFSETYAISTGKRVLDILRRAHDEGYRIGYLGPENVLTTYEGNHFILGGARGIPDTPFSPPEAVGSTVDDPRSDVYALGLLIFRLIAGSDDREIQIEIWNRLSDRALDLLEHMVSPEPDNRFPNLMVLAEKLGQVKSYHAIPETDLPRQRSRSRTARGKIPIYVYALIAAAIAIGIILLVNPGQHQAIQNIEPDTTSLTPENTTQETAPVLPEENVVSAPGDTMAEPVIWISNGTGVPGRASEFRQDTASEFSNVYACTASPRGNSIVLARRDDPGIPLEDQQRIFPVVEYLASHDSTLLITPVDITLLLGGDLSDDVIQSGILTAASDPSGTLYVDIVNHGLESTFGGTGAATWARSVLHGRSITLGGEEWLIEVVDFRDGDRLNTELGIPTVLDRTLFLYRRELPLLNAAEEELRKVFFDSPGTGQPEPAAPIPDIWIILGS
jgi:hypothetical protein